MADHLGVTNLFGLTAPSVGHVSASEKKSNIGVATVRNASGVTVIAKAKQLIKDAITLRGKGDAEFANVTAGAITKGTPKIVRAKQSETNDDFPDFEIEAVNYSNRTEPE